MNNIAIYGAGGFGREVACMLNAINDRSPTWNFIGFFDDGIPLGTTTRFGPLIGTIKELNDFPEEMAVIMAVANPVTLESIIKKIHNPRIYFPNIMAPSSYLIDANSVNMGKGNVLFFGSRFSCDVSIGDFNLMNGSVSLGHDVTVGNFNVFGPSSRISGNCDIGNTNFFGVNSVVLQGVRIGSNTRIGAGSVVIRKTKDNSLYIGNPAKKVEI